VFSLSGESKSPMPNTLLDHVSTITLHRDTALLDRSVITSLIELLKLEEARLVDIYRLDNELFFTTSAWSESGRIFGQNDLPPDADALPLATYQGGREAIASRTTCERCDAGRYRYWIPVFTDDIPVACFELTSITALDSHRVDLATGIIGLYRNYRALLEDSQQDTLTGLSNRKTFDRSLAHFLNSASKGSEDAGYGDEKRRPAADTSSTHWLAVIDIDHFKRVNDQFGHLFGDEVLILLANRMRGCFRQNDKLFRFGGEEFVVLLQHVDAAGAKATLERFRAKIAAENFPQVGKVTVSIGFAPAREADTPSALLGSADEALYFAKSNGRNQVCSYDELVASGLLKKKEVHTEAEFF
jgi:diguanylate cyclase (GGDEF)-like protein